MTLSILITSIFERASMLSLLLDNLSSQLSAYKHQIHLITSEEEQIESYPENEVEVIIRVDNREMTIGAKRQWLLEKATGDWICYLDDDDMPYPSYVDSIVKAIKKDKQADCIGSWGKMTKNDAGNYTWCHRLGWPTANNHKGFTHTHPIWHFSPVKREKALQAGFETSEEKGRFGEDAGYAARLNPLLTKEVFIEQPLFLYRYNDKVPHKVKYGIKL